MSEKPCPVLQNGHCEEPTVPDSIFLQIEYDGERTGPFAWTHSAERINDSDVEYVRKTNDET